MSRSPTRLVIDARSRGPRGPFAVELVQGRAVIDHLLDLAAEIEPDRDLSVVVSPDDRALIQAHINAHPSGRFVIAGDRSSEGATVLRTDRLYDASRLRKALKHGKDPDAAAIWRLDVPHGLEGADDELIRRRTFQPLGRYWALTPARGLARALAPTRIRPNAVTLAAGSLVLGAAGIVAFLPKGFAPNVTAAAALASALVLDTSDGHLARLQGTASAFGRWLDGWLDEVGDMVLHAAVAWSAFSQTGWVGWLLLGMLYAMGKFLFVVGTSGMNEGEQSAGARMSAPPESFAARVVRLAGHADLRWHLWIVLAALGKLEVALAAYAVYCPARAVLGAARKAVRHG